MTLKERFDDFCSSYPGVEVIDQLENPPKGTQKADYLFEKRTIVCEVKSLEANMVDKLLNGLKSDGIDPKSLKKGRHIIEELYSNLPKGENLYNQLKKNITTSVEKAIDDAANQIAGTKQQLGIGDADGLLVILNEAVTIIGQPLVDERLQLAFPKKNQHGKPYHSDVTRVLHIGETNAVETAAGDVRINTVIQNPHGTANHGIDDFVKQFVTAWAGHNGQPLKETGPEIADLLANSKLYIDVL